MFETFCSSPRRPRFTTDTTSWEIIGSPSSCSIPSSKRNTSKLSRSTMLTSSAVDPWRMTMRCKGSAVTLRDERSPSTKDPMPRSTATVRAMPKAVMSVVPLRTFRLRTL